MRLALKAVAAAAAVATAACAPALRSTATAPLSPAQMAEFWREPADLTSRDLFHGAGGKEQAPAADAVWRYLSTDTVGFSGGYDVAGPDGREWDVKLGPEAHTEVVASRILWAVGYHQPPAYLVSRWRIEGAPGVDGSWPQPAARFRPDVPGMKSREDWSWYENPFVGTTPYRGLLVLNMLISNWDLKETNNKVYEPVANGAPGRWFVVRDLGASLGKNRGYFPGTRNNVEDYERQGFVVGVEGGRVRFAYGGRHRKLVDAVGPADVVWICGRLARLSDAQWNDAFRAGGYGAQTTARFVAAIKRKIAQGLALESRRGEAGSLEVAQPRPGAPAQFTR